ncbi:hypothetical protein GNIT_0717 [Glaciecola nitratireducens FR1064]|uniref:Uncharacterized protein n=1 Tax=Glaciecola nitratireducens (strain JCM 12485 / KCTC 12276 / FR1064) TaxID=1085623 RepID=G4QFS6_GLANF|nr:hypothetical protein GNIT_0717 [Glaciecola nitratireducens FR1064]
MKAHESARVIKKPAESFIKFPAGTLNAYDGLCWATIFAF